ncbi:transcription factor CP2-like [Styela clava]
MLAENLSQLVSNAEVAYTANINKAQNSHRNIPIPPQLPQRHHSENSKSSPDLANWVKMDEQALVKDFDANLSGLGLELGAGAYNMSEVLNLPIFKQEDSIVANTGTQNLPPLQYMLQAPTSPASKVHEETLTYLNQGQAYEVRLKRLSDLPNVLSSKLAKSFLRVVFHDRRLQYTEHQQLEGWKFSRPGDRLLNIDIPMSVGIMQPRQPSNLLNLVEFVWDLDKQASVYVQVHCISTEFTPKKHGGERGVPFRIQVDTYSLDGNGEMGEHIHSASCQIKVFKPKGADRKQKTDKDKMEKRTAQEKLKYQPSYESTLLTECSPTPMSLYEDALSVLDAEQRNERQPYNESPIDAAVEVDLSAGGSYLMEEASPDGTNGGRSSLPGSYSRSYMEAVRTVTQQQVPCPPVKGPDILQPYATTAQTIQWLQRNRFSTFAKTFNSFSGADMLSLTREDLIQICGSAEGIRLYNSLRVKKVQARLTLYMTPATPESDGEIKVYRAFYLEQLTASELIKEAASLFEQQNGGGRPHITRALYQPTKSNVHVLVTDELVGTLRDEQCFTVLVIKNEGSDGFQIILKQ